MTVFDKQRLPSAEEALPDRSTPVSVPSRHFINGHSLVPPFPDNIELIYLGMGCFWGAERVFWQQGGVWTTAVGYMGGYTANPTYEEVCSGLTGHTEAVLVGYDPQIIATDSIIRLFWESHDPTQGMRQGNDKGTQYRSAIFITFPAQHELVISSLERYQKALSAQEGGKITTDIQQAGTFYYAEEYHQQYLGKNPEGYCGIGGTGVCLPDE